jgi:hypothetical protein
MKHKVAPDDSNSDGNERPVKRRRRDSSCTVPISLGRQQQKPPQPPPSPLSEDLEYKVGNEYSSVMAI